MGSRTANAEREGLNYGERINTGAPLEWKIQTNGGGFPPQASVYFCRGHSGDGVNNVLKRQMKPKQMRRFREIKGCGTHVVGGKAGSAQGLAESRLKRVPAYVAET